MKRFHVNLSVADLETSIEFYETLFGETPTVRKKDYAKWMLDDPRLNFAISQSARARGIDHVGLQADTLQELGEIRERLRAAHARTLDQPGARCCYARSTKTWVRDPDDVAWETFVTHGEIERFGDDIAPLDRNVSQPASRCCA